MCFDEVSLASTNKFFQGFFLAVSLTTMLNCVLNMSYIYVFWCLCYISSAIELLGTDGSIAQRVWNSMEPHVINDLQYLKSLAKTESCQQKIEDAYIQHVSYSVVRKEDSYSFDLQNLCPSQISSPSNSNNNLQIIIDNNNNNATHINHTNMIVDRVITNKPLRIVYFIMMHQHPFQVIRLLSTLNTTNDIFLIHIDAKSSSNVSSVIQQFAEAHINIYLV